MENDFGFPGQYYEEETGLWQNWFRDYDPVTGRYIEGDPIGLKGGVNAYSYAKANPINHIDPLGNVVIIPFDEFRCAKLRADVIINCKIKWHGKKACKYTDDCPMLLEKIKLRFRCMIAQMELTRECYPNDPTHIQRLVDELNGVKKCRDILKEKECISCPR